MYDELLNTELHDELVERIRQLVRPLEPVATDRRPRLEVLDDIRSVVFDVYGTMFISRSGDIGFKEETGDVEALRQAFEYFDIAFSPEAPETGVGLFREAIDAWHRARKLKDVPHPEVEIREIWQEVLGRLAGRGLIEMEVTALQVVRLAVEFEIRFNPPWLMPGMMHTLEHLRPAGLQLGIVSNSQFYTPLSLEALTDRSPQELGFDPRLLKWSYRYGIAKPSIGFYELLVEDLKEHHDIRPGQVLYVGNDMLNDICPAAQLGIRTALFSGDKRSLKLRKGEPRCEGVSPDLELTFMPQLLECLPVRSA